MRLFVLNLCLFVCLNMYYFNDTIRYTIDFDWRSSDFQVSVAFICGMIGSIIVLKKVGCQGFLFFLFGLSIVGGAIPFILEAISGGAGGGMGGGGGRRGGKGRRG